MGEGQKRCEVMLGGPSRDCSICLPQGTAPPLPPHTACHLHLVAAPTPSGTYRPLGGKNTLVPFPLALRPHVTASISSPPGLATQGHIWNWPSPSTFSYTSGSQPVGHENFSKPPSPKTYLHYNSWIVAKLQFMVGGSHHNLRNY